MDKQSTISPTQALSNELLLSSLSGTYSYSTLSGIHLKKNHGLFISCIPYFNLQAYVLLSSLHETLFFDGKGIELVSQANKKNADPKECIPFIDHCSDNPLPIIEYIIGDVKLRKQSLIREGEGNLLIKYTLLESPTELNLQLSPMLSYRKVDELTLTNTNHNALYGEKDNGVSFKMYPDFPSVNIQCSKPITYQHKPNWKSDFEYPQDKVGQQAFSEDLYNPGNISIAMQQGESIIIHIGTSAADARLLKTSFEAEKRKRRMLATAPDYLSHVARQFFVLQVKQAQILSVLPFQASTALDFFRALPGLRITLKNNHTFVSAELAAIVDLKRVMENKKASPLLTGWNNPELFLWACWSFLLIQKPDEISQNFYYDLAIQIIQAIRKGKITGIRLRKNGLIWIDPPKEKKQETKNNYIAPHDKRKGYRVELNAIWYNALVQAEHYLAEGSFKNKFQKLSIKCEEGFQTMFWDAGQDSLIDSSDGKVNNPEIRAFGLFAVSQRYSPLDKFQQKAVLSTITGHLYTANGLRGLSPKHPHYSPNGSVLPWLSGSYSDALIKILKKDGLHPLTQISKQLKKIVRKNNGNIPLAFSGNPPYNKLENSASILSIAEVSRTLHTIKKYKKHLKKNKDNFEDVLYGEKYV